MINFLELFNKKPCKEHKYSFMDVAQKLLLKYTMEWDKSSAVK